MRYKVIITIFLFVNACLYSQVPYELFGYNCCAVDGEEQYYLYEGCNMGVLGLHVGPAPIYGYPLAIFMEISRNYENGYGYAGFFAGAATDTVMRYRFENEKLLLDWIIEKENEF